MKNVLTELFDIETKRPIETGLFRFGSALIVYETIGGLYLLCIDELTKFDMMSRPTARERSLTIGTSRPTSSSRDSTG